MKYDVASPHQGAGPGFPRAAVAGGEGDHWYAAAGKAHIDFSADAGTMNYGHRREPMRHALLTYAGRGCATPSFDPVPTTMTDFVARFEELILRKRSLEYSVHFPGPTGVHAVRAAFDLARRVTHRYDIVSFANAFHGMPIHELAPTGQGLQSGDTGGALTGTIVMPYYRTYESGLDSLTLLEALFEHQRREGELPAAVLLETVLADGGMLAASMAWIRSVGALCKRHNILLIVDETQSGCGRTGPFFSFEPAGIEPDIVCLSKGLSGNGLPLAITLVHPKLDVWTPSEDGEAIGRHNPAFATASAALDFWADDRLEQHVMALGTLVEAALVELLRCAPQTVIEQRGRGLFRCLELAHPCLGDIGRAALERGLVIGSAGSNREILKIAPPLTIERATLEVGLGILRQAVLVVAASRSHEPATLVVPQEASRR